MLVKFGGGVLAASGSIGGQTFARNRSGNYVRSRTKPVNPNTARQQAVRSNMTGSTGRWSSTLTALQRAEWATYAAAIAWQNKLGETIKLTGFNHYVRSATSLLAAGGVVVDDGPAILSLPDGDPLVAVTALATGQALSVSFDDSLPWLDEDGAHMVVQMGTPQNITRNFFNGPWRQAGVIDGDGTTAPTTPQAMTAPFAIQEGQLVYFQFRIIRADGRVSQTFRTSATVGA
ncbi:MAG: hypothetical protein KAJ07_09690 [Planctomycetes bacterium]|nr:hypothetical protein [Planctomycetota bacterium]